MLDLNNEKIDLVYTWVDDGDEEWRVKKNHWAESENVPIDPAHDCRYTNNDELKYSLRSVEKYAPWINKIFIVTDNQIPSWLNTSHEKIRVVDHKEIIPQKYLPTFNSRVIEHCLVNIEGLSEFFLYANDDTFFNRYVTPGYFYIHNGNPIVRFRGKYDKNSDADYIKALNYTYNLIYKKYGYNCEYYPHHNIDAYRKSYIQNCKQVFQNEIENSLNNRFRINSSPQRYIYNAYMVATKQGEFKRVKILDTSLPLYKKIINKLIGKYSADSAYIDMIHSDYGFVLKRTNPYLFCLNDTEGTTNSDRKRAGKFLQSLFSEKSSFEL